jgi:hypothetical protein
MQNHLKMCDTAPGEDTCRICWDVYGGWNLSFGRPDVAVQVIGIEGCSHVFGWGCLSNEVFSGDNNLCPLCRTAWFTKPKFLRDEGGQMSDHEAHIDEFSSGLADLLKVDYETARYAIYREEKYADSVAPLRMPQFFSDLRDEYRIAFAVKYDEIQQLITELQKSSPSPIDERLYDPYAGCQELYLYNDPFTFRNWHVSDSLLASVVSNGLKTINGMRLIEMLNRKLEAKEDAIGVIRQALPAQECWDFEAEAVDKTAQAWVEWCGEEHVRNFSRVLMKVYLVFKYPEGRLEGE